MNIPKSQELKYFDVASLINTRLLSLSISVFISSHISKPPERENKTLHFYEFIARARAN